MPQPIAACSTLSARSKPTPPRSTALWEARREAQDAADAHRAEVERAKRESDWLRHAVEELGKLAPQAGEETALAERRTAHDAGREGGRGPARRA